MFQQLNCQLIACSCDTEETHLAWIKTPRKKGGLGHMQIPIMADTTKVSFAGSLPSAQSSSTGLSLYCCKTAAQLVWLHTHSVASRLLCRTIALYAHPQHADMPCNFPNQDHN